MFFPLTLSQSAIRYTEDTRRMRSSRSFGGSSPRLSSSTMLISTLSAAFSFIMRRLYALASSSLRPRTAASRTLSSSSAASTTLVTCSRTMARARDSRRFRNHSSWDFSLKLQRLLETLVWSGVDQDVRLVERDQNIPGGIKALRGSHVHGDQVVRGEADLEALRGAEE